MNGVTIFYSFTWICGISAIVIGVFMVLRCLNHFKNWREGNADQLWLFLAYVIGGCILSIIGIGLILFITANSSSLYGIINELIPVLLYISLIPIGLTTYWYILQLRKK
ncbi:MAG: hypothetical protein ACTSQI_13370 [Candidatus Helarchaeota archaeon]